MQKSVKLIIQPGAGVAPVVKGIEKATRSIELLIFRFDTPEIERALIKAVERGLYVHALIAFTNHGGEERLRKLEASFLAHGITVSRTANDLVRYHGKMMIIDRKELHVLSFNFSRSDLGRSRSFGLITRNPKLVAEAIRLFEADGKRQVYTSEYRHFLVSPINARRELTKFLQGAKKELLIYDPKISDRAMLRILEERQEAGVAIRVIGSVAGDRLPACELKGIRLHTRTMVRDRTQAFTGSQSLRQIELDARREIGVIFRDKSVVRQLIRTFEADWAAFSSNPLAKQQKISKPSAPRKKALKSLVRSVTRKIPLAPVAKKLAKLISKSADVDLDKKKIRETVEDVVEDVVEQAAEEAVFETGKTVA